MQVSATSNLGTSAAVMHVGARTSRSMDLSIVTAEGDRVTLSASSTRALGYAAAAGTSDGTSVLAGALQVNGSDDVSLSVEGNLSHEELVDLQKVVKAFERAAAKGDASRLIDRLSRPDLDTIGSISGRAQWETSLSASVLSAQL
jgi:hypothetical protein